MRALALLSGRIGDASTGYGSRLLALGCMDGCSVKCWAPSGLEPNGVWQQLRFYSCSLIASLWAVWVLLRAQGMAISVVSAASTARLCCLQMPLLVEMCSLLAPSVTGVAVAMLRFWLALKQW